MGVFRKDYMPLNFQSLLSNGQIGEHLESNILKKCCVNFLIR